jgi:hypothetical protein
MNQFTESDLTKLRRIFFVMMDGYDPYVPVILDGKINYIEFIFISDILDKRLSPLVLKTRSKPIQRIHELIFLVPITQIPLHINSSPAIANWRLKIANRSEDITEDIIIDEDA